MTPTVPHPAAGERRPLALEALAVVLLFAATTLAGHLFQPSISYRGGAPWDAEGYVFMAKRLAEGVPLAGTAPFVHRLGTPYLASFLDLSDPIDAFRRVNVVANACATVLLWLTRFVARPWIRVLLCALFVAHWNGFTRFVFYLSPITDPWALVFVLVGLLLVDELGRGARAAGRPWLLVLLGATVLGGTLFREFVAALGMAALFARNPVVLGGARRVVIRWAEMLPFLPVLGCGIAGIALSHGLVTATNDYSFAATAWWFLWNKPPAVYLLAWLEMFSPWLFFVVYDWRETVRFVLRQQAMLVFLAAIVCVSWVGGGHTERFVFWASPVVLLLVGRALERHAHALTAPIAALLALVSILVGRVLWVTPDHPPVGSGATFLVFTTLGPGTGLFDLLTFTQSMKRVLLADLQHLAVGALLLVWLWRRAAQAARREASFQASTGKIA